MDDNISLWVALSNFLVFYSIAMINGYGDYVKYLVHRKFLMTFKIIFYFLCIFWRLGTANAAPIDTETLAKPLRVYFANGSIQNTDVWIKHLSELTPEELQNFSATAGIVFKGDLGQYVVKSHDINLSENYSNLPEGWKLVQDKGFLWKGGAALSKSLAVPLDVSMKGGSSSDSFSSYDALWIDYSLLPGLDPCQLGVKLESQSQFWNKNSLRSKMVSQTGFDSSDQKLLSHIDVNDAPLKPRDWGYLLGRFFRQKPDESWQYLGRKDDTLIQGRMHIDLNKAVWLDLILDPTYTVNHINLSIRDRDDYSSGEVIKVDSLPKVVKFQNGKYGIRINLHQLLSQRSSVRLSRGDKNDFYLQEIFIFVSGKGPQILASKPLREILLWGDSEAKAQLLESTDQDLSFNMRRLEVNLAPITSQIKNGEVVSLEGGDLTLRPPPRSMACGVSIKKVYFVRKNEDRVPAYVKRIDDYNRYLGGPFKLFAHQYDSVEQPIILGYLPLNLITYPSQINASTGITFEAFKKNEETESSLPAYRILKKTESINQRSVGNFTGPFGSVLFAKEGIRPLKSRNGVWSFNGDSPQLILDWPAELKVSSDTWFILKVEDELAKIGDVEITLQSVDGQRFTSLIEPNRPVHLVQNPLDIKSVRLTFSPLNLPYRFNLSELVIFESKVVGYKQVFNALMPSKIMLKPSLTFISPQENALEVQPGHIVGIADSGKMSFSTVFDSPISSLRGITLGFRMPAVYKKNNDECLLQIRMNWDKKSIQRSFCPKTHEESNLFVPVTALLDEVKLKKNLGVLRSIDWLISFPRSIAHNPIQTFSLDFVIDGLAFESAAGWMANSPLFNVGGKRVLLNSSGIEGSSTYALKTTLQLDDGVITRIANADGVITQVDNPLFELSEIKIYPKNEAGRDSLSKFADSIRTTKSSRWLIPFLLLAFLLIYWISSRRKCARYFDAMWTCSGKVVYLICKYLTTKVKNLLGYIYRWLPWIKELEVRRPGIARCFGWNSMALIFYSIGLINTSKLGENYYFTFGGLAAAIALQATLLMFKPQLTCTFPKIASYVYRGGGSLYFTGMLLVLVGMALLLLAGLEKFAEQLAMVFYYCLAVGTTFEILELYRKD